MAFVQPPCSTVPPDRRPRRPIARRAAVLAASLLLGALAAPAGALAQDAGPPPPSAPPGAGADLPAPPGTHSLPAAPAPPATTVEAAPSAPNLMGEAALVNRKTRQVTLGLYCTADGRVRITASRLTKGPLATTSYRCGGNHAAPRLRLPTAAVKRLSRLRSALATVTIRQGGALTSSALTLSVGSLPAPRAADFWTDGSLQCSPTGQPQAYLVAPNYTANPPTPIYIRPWVAVYTAQTGWRWIGTRGVGSSQWTAITATPTGVAEWRQPSGSLAPWTWGPITMPLGSNMYAAGVFEVVYWWSGGPRYVWDFVRPDSTGLDASGAFCRYF